jgi:hypothetical protein
MNKNEKSLISPCTITDFAIVFVRTYSFLFGWNFGWQAKQAENLRLIIEGCADHGSGVV